MAGSAVLFRAAITDIAFTEDVEARFKAYGWQVLRVADSEDIEAMEAAVKEAQADTEHPSLNQLHAAPASHKP